MLKHSAFTLLCLFLGHFAAASWDCLNVELRFGEARHFAVDRAKINRLPAAWLTGIKQLHATQRGRIAVASFCRNTPNILQPAHREKTEDNIWTTSK